MLLTHVIHAYNLGYEKFNSEKTAKEFQIQLDWRMDKVDEDYYVYRNMSCLPTEVFLYLFSGSSSLYEGLKRWDIIQELHQINMECFSDSSSSDKWESYVVGLPDYESMTNEKLIEEYKTMAVSELEEIEPSTEQELWIKFLAECLDCHEQEETGNMPCDNGCLCDKCRTEYTKNWFEHWKAARKN